MLGKKCHLNEGRLNFAMFSYFELFSADCSALIVQLESHIRACDGVRAERDRPICRSALKLVFLTSALRSAASGSTLRSRSRVSRMSDYRSANNHNAHTSAIPRHSLNSNNVTLR